MATAKYISTISLTQRETLKQHILSQRQCGPSNNVSWGQGRQGNGGVAKY